ncbi:hypothetical protein [Pedobacter jeongneungensis]
MANKVFIILLLISLTVFANARQKASIKQTRVSFIAKNQTASQIFKIIEAKTAYRFSYSPSDISGKLLLNFSYHHQTLEKILQDLALTSNLKFLVHEHAIGVSVNYPPTSNVIRIKP